MRRALLCAGGLSLALAACAGSGPPLVTHRYLAIEGSQPALPRLLISASAQPAPDAADGIALIDLAPDAQAEVVKASGGRPPLRLQPSPEQARAFVNNQLRRRIVVALRPVTILPLGTRLMAAQIRMVPDDAGRWRFVGWDRLEKNGAVIEVGIVKTERKTGFNGELNLAIGGPVGTPKLGFETSRQRNEEMVVRDTLLQSAAIDGDGAAWIDQRAGAGQDLATNTQFDAVVELAASDLDDEPLHVLPPLTRDGTRLPPSAVTIGQLSVSAPPSNGAKPICGTVEMVGWLRTIVKGAATYTEADDVIRIDEVKDSARFRLAPAQVLPIYGLTGATTLQIWLNGQRQPSDLRFADVADALLFADWLRETGPAAGRLANARIGLADGAGGMAPLTAAMIASLRPGLVNLTQVTRARAADARGCDGGGTGTE